MLSLETLQCLTSKVGLDACGVVAANRLDEDAQFMDQWIQQGLHGNMSYLERNRSLRYDPRQLVPGAQSIVVCLLTYEHSGHDYHRTMKSKLYELEAMLGIPPTACQNKFCDSAPFLERRWAVNAGLGIIGKNHQFIHPVFGSYVHIGELVLTEPVEPSSSIVPADFACGDCTRCINACPGCALGQPEWDARKCIAYTTHKCTICQQVCPLNIASKLKENMKPLNELRIALASDHAGYALKQTVSKYLLDQGAYVNDFGCHSTESCDYPDFAHPMAAAVEKGIYDFGIAICSTGNGITMTCNHHPAIRAALCWDTPLADLARRHNNANILGLPANYIAPEKALEIVDTFFQTDFEGGRHERRVTKIPV